MPKVTDIRPVRWSLGYVGCSSTVRFRCPKCGDSFFDVKSIIFKEEHHAVLDDLIDQLNINNTSCPSCNQLLTWDNLNNISNVINKMVIDWEDTNG